MRGFTSIPSVDLLLFAALLICGNLVLRQKHPHEVYVIWLVFSFLFSIFLPIAYIAETTHTDVDGVCTTYLVTCAKIYEMLTDFDDEVKFLFIFAAVTVAPQVLAYLLAGVWGTATAPQYVWVVKQTAIWSFIKFVAGLGGILMAQALAKLFAGKVVGLNDFLPAVNYTAIAFAYATLNFWFRESWDKFYRNHFLGDRPEPWYIRWLIVFHKKCTRKIPTRPAPTLARRALIELAKSDAVYDYITRTRNAG
jgi:hypothetical protein